MGKKVNNTKFSLGEQLSVEELTNIDGTHTFSKEYQDKKLALLDSIGKKESIRKVQMRKYLSIAAAVLIILVIPASTFAAKQIKEGFFTKKVNQYQYEIEYNDQNGDNTGEGQSITNPDLYHTYVQIQFNYRPDGYVDNTNTKSRYIICSETESNQKIYISIVRLYQNRHLSVDNTVDTKNIKIGDRQATIFYKNVIDDTDFNKDMLIYYNDYGYAIEMNAQVKVPEEELIHIAENMELIPCDENVAMKTMDSIQYTGNSPVESSPSEITQDVISQLRYIDKSKMVSLNTPVCLEDEKYKYSSKIEYTVKDFEIRDSISGLDENDFNSHFLEVADKYMDEDGNFIGYTHQNIEYGDRVNTVDQLMGEEHIDMKLVYVTIKAKNTSMEEVEQISLAPQICCLDMDNIAPLTYSSEVFGSDGTEVYCDYPTMYQQDPESYSGVQKMLASGCYAIPAGDEITFHVAYVVDADKMDNMVLFYNKDKSIFLAASEKSIRPCIIQLSR